MELTKTENNLLIQVVGQRCNDINDKLIDFQSIIKEGREPTDEQYDEVSIHAIALKNLHQVMLKLADEQDNKSVANDIREISHSQIEWTDGLLEMLGVENIESSLETINR